MQQPLIPFFIDAYKLGHRSMYPEGTTLVYSNMAVRSFEHINNVLGFEVDEYVSFGVESAILELKEGWGNFFDMTDSGFNRFLNNYKNTAKRYSGGADDYDVNHIIDLFNNSQLPIKFKCLPDGTVVKGKNIPFVTIENTDPKFFWLVNYIESDLSARIWKSIVSATIAFHLRKVCNKLYEQTAGADMSWFVDYQCHDFSFRGLSGHDDVCKVGAAHLTSFLGTDNLAADAYVIQMYNAVEPGGSVPACYDEQTEILTNKGWKFFNDLNEFDETELVAQYKENGEIDFVKPSKYYKCKYKGEMIHFTKSGGYNYFDTMVTPNHKMVVLNKKNKLSLREANSDWNYTNSLKQIVSGNKVGDGSLSALEKLRIAFQADGSFPSHKEDYNGDNGGKFPIRFSIKKERKKERLMSILEELGYNYTLNQYKNGYYSFWINSEVEMYKDFSWVDIHLIDQKRGAEFIEELSYWDGHKTKVNCIVYSTVEYKNITTLQAIASLSGFKSHYRACDDKRDDYKRKILHTLTFKSQSYVGGDNVVKNKVDYEGYVYCVSVPSKMLVVKRNDIISICGNTEHSVASCSILRYESEGLSKFDAERKYLNHLITNVYPTGILSYVSDTFDFWRLVTEILPLEKDTILNRNGKLVVRPDSGCPIKIICGDPDANTEHERKGLIETLADIFGYTTNEKGYKQLAPQIGAIYGDSITPQRLQTILQKLKAKGFASTNIVFGIGLT